MAGAGVGVVTGFLGVGGGFLIVPALLFFTALLCRCLQPEPLGRLFDLRLDADDRTGEALHVR